MNQKHGNPKKPPGACRQIHERMVWKPAVLRTQISWAKRARKSKRFEADWKMEYLVPWYHLKRCSKPHFPILSPLEWQFYGVIPLCQTHPEDHMYPFHLSAMLMIGGWIIFHSLAKQLFFLDKGKFQKPESDDVRCWIFKKCRGCPWVFFGCPKPTTKQWLMQYWAYWVDDITHLKSSRMVGRCW